MAVAIYNHLNRPENCHFYIQSRADSLKNEFKVELTGSIHKVTNDSVELLKTTESDMDSLLSQTNNMAQSVHTSSSAVEEMIGNVRSIANIIESNFEVVQKLEEATKIGSADLSEVTELVGTIEEESENLMNMSRMVGQIASQTNLLAMNAAIEAAKQLKANTDDVIDSISNIQL